MECDGGSVQGPRSASPGPNGVVDRAPTALVRSISDGRLGLMGKSTRKRDPAATPVSIRGAVLAGVLAIGILLLLPIPAGPGAAAPGARALGEPPVVLPVWAIIDGDTPVSGGSVRVLGPGGSALEQVSPTDETTGPRGTSLLEFSELPSAFTVVVSGGEVRGKRLDGELRADVREYRPSGAGVVHVSPVTTMIAEDIRARRRRGEEATVGAATRGIERLLRIPAYVDATDLRRSDEFFDGDTFLKRAGGGPGVPELIDELVRTELRPGDPKREFVPHGGKRGAPAQPRALTVQASAQTSPRIPGPVIKVYKALSETAVGKLSDYVGLSPELKQVLIGWLMSGWAKVLGEDEAPEKGDMAEIRDLLKTIDDKLTEVEKSVAQGKLDVLAALTNDTLGRIDHASEDLSYLANAARADPSKPNFAAAIGTYVGTKLLDAPAILHRHLGASVPLADSILKAASQAQSKRRFFDASDSARVKSVFDYYALYQAQLATLLTNYWHTKPDTYSGEYIRAQVAKIEANTAEQATLLKPPVPDGAVVETRTNKIWTQNYSPNSLPASLFYRREPPGGLVKTVWPQDYHGPRAIEGLPGGNWTLPSRAEIESLIDGRGSTSGVQWLKDKAGMSGSQANGGGGLAFMSRPSGWTSHTDTVSRIDSLEIFRYDLWRGIVVRDVIVWGGDPCRGRANDERCLQELRRKLEAVKGATMYVRPLANDETYWWG
jgi:hypothetical protein